LKDTVEHPNLKYVTIFGNARLVPPSYYVYIVQFEDFNYCNWIPTDFFYASPDYDLFPNLMVGRLPVNSSAEAEHVVEKIENWDGNVSYDWFKNVSLGGGMPFGTIYYIGELATVDSINRNYFNGMNVTEFFRTDGNFDKANLINSLFGTHNGTITPNQTITVSKMYTYSCSGTGGHSEYVRIWNSSTLNVTAKCEEFIDANGKKYNNRIPAIRLWA